MLPNAAATFAPLATCRKRTFLEDKAFDSRRVGIIFRFAVHADDFCYAAYPASMFALRNAMPLSPSLSFPSSSHAR